MKSILNKDKNFACKIISAISDRGSKKDFIDLYFLLEKYSLNYLLNLFDKKYKGIAYNRMHILKSLLYFQDADKEIMPKMIKKASWKKVKEKIIKEVKKL